MVGAAVLAQFVFMSISGAAVGVLLLPATTELGWQAWQFTLGPSLSIASGIVSGAYVGRYIDRRGARRPMFLGAIVSAACLCALSTQTSIWAYWGLYVVCGLIGWSLFGPQVVNPVLTKWFVENRGWALAIGSVGVSLAGMITPAVMTPLVDGYGWRSGFLFLSVAALCVAPVSFVMRRTPEDHGWQPDGAASGTGETSMESTQSLTRPQAVRTISFWLLVIGFGLNTMALVSILVHAIPFATSSGFTRSVAAIAVSFTGVGNLSSKAVWGKALGSIRPKYLILTAYAVAISGVACTLFAASAGNATILATGFFLYGFGFGGTIPLSESLWAAYFGRKHIGAIRGLSAPISALGTSIGPVLVGFWFDYSQSYTTPFVAIGLAYATAGLFIGISRKPSQSPKSA